MIPQDFVELLRNESRYFVFFLRLLCIFLLSGLFDSLMSLMLLMPVLIPIYLVLAIYFSYL